MEEFHCAGSMDDDQEGDWGEILQKWESHHALAVDQGLPPPLTQPTSCTSILTPPAMESLNPIFLPPDPQSNSCNTSSTFNPSLRHSSHSFTRTSSINQLNPLSLEVPANHFAASLGTIDADNLISTVRQPDDASDALRSSWFSTFLQSLTPTGLASSSNSSFHNLLNTGVDMPQGLLASTTAAPSNNLYSNPAGLEEMMEQMSNDFINYGGAGSLQEQLSSSLSASDMVRAELMKAENEGLGSANEGVSVQMLVQTPASSVSSDGGPDDDSDSHEDIKDSLDMALDDLIVPSGDHPHLNILSSPGTPSSKATKSQGETSAAPSGSQDQDKKRAQKSTRVTKKPKRERGAKLAIKIQSDVEILDDGYKWRKYGQKAVKNSPYPRSYYKCTDKQCKVKKHVERQAHEPEFVVTTYEGVHNHSRPDQQVQVLHPQSDITSQQHDSFQAFVPTPTTYHLSTMEILGLRTSPLFQGDSQPVSLPLQQSTSSTQTALEALELQDLLHGEPTRSLS